MVDLNKQTVICPDCKGNGFIRVPYEAAKEEVHAQCKTCSSQGELDPDELIRVIEEQRGKIKFLQNACRKAGAEIKELNKVINAVQRGVDYERRAKDFSEQ